MTHLRLGGAPRLFDLFDSREPFHQALFAALFSSNAVDETQFFDEAGDIRED